MSRIVRAGRIFVAMLHEIFDEAAYARFLRRSKLQPSRETYAAFWSDRETDQQRRPKCC